MAEGYLNLRDARQIADFMISVMDFLPAKDQKVYQKMVDDIQAGKEVPEERLIEMVKNMGAVSWPKRYAIKKFLEDMGSELEFEAVTEAIRPATRALLKELRKSSGAKTLDEALQSSDAAIVIHPEQEVEIEMVREQVRLQLWEERADHLKELIQEGVTELEAIRKRLQQLRKQAEKMDGSQQDLLFQKLNSYEDKLYFGGEILPLSMLEEELKYDAADASDPIVTK